MKPMRFGKAFNLSGKDAFRFIVHYIYIPENY